MKSQGFPNLQTEAERVASCAQGSGESAERTFVDSPLPCETIEVLHDLNNAFAAVLMNAQVMECKLPSYSRSKRYIHEIERSAQRGSALLKRLLGHLAGGCGAPHQDTTSSTNASVPPPVSGSVAVVASQEPCLASEEGVMHFALSSEVGAAPVFSSD
jgi:hypothetical protein